MAVTMGECRTCHKKWKVEYREWYHASQPRCLCCGGMMDNMGSWEKKVSTKRKSKNKRKEKSSPLLQEYRLTKFIDRNISRFYDKYSKKNVLNYDRETRIFWAPDGKKGWAKTEESALRKYLKPYVSPAIKEMDRDLDRIAREGLV